MLELEDFSVGPAGRFLLLGSRAEQQARLWCYSHEFQVTRAGERRRTLHCVCER